jgi:Ni/Co efflux regulator RcnB
MRKLLIALAALAVVGTSLPVVSAASAQTVVVKERHHDRGLHRGEWRRHQAKKVVIIKRDRGHHYGRRHVVHERY